jgi:hypothetical protein
MIQLGGSRDGTVAIVIVEGDEPLLDETVVWLLQLAPKSKLLDLSAALFLRSDVFRTLVNEWNAPPGSVPRLGVLLSFVGWTMLGDFVRAELQPLVEKGVAVEVFYEEQAHADREGLSAWFSGGEVVHNISAVVEALVARWRPTSNWREVLETVERLVRASVRPDDVPALLVDVATIALVCCRSAEEGARLASEALRRLPASPSLPRCRALRVFGSALIRQHHGATGVWALDDAVAMAMVVGSPREAAAALCESAVHLRERGDVANAESRYRRVVELLSGSGEYVGLLALAHLDLAAISLQHGKDDDGETHARVAVVLAEECGEPELAEDSRLLLLRIIESRGTN